MLFLDCQDSTGGVVHRVTPALHAAKAGGRDRCVPSGPRPPAAAPATRNLPGGGGVQIGVSDTHALSMAVGTEGVPG